MAFHTKCRCKLAEGANMVVNSPHALTASRNLTSDEPLAPSFLCVGYPQCPRSREEWLLELSCSDRLKLKATR